jgi:hypothetical protein
MKFKFLIQAVIIFVLLCSCNRNIPIAQTQNDQLNYTPPSWAPYYTNVNQVPYYYLPDIECYYDVLSHDFIYMQDGNWLFASQLPSSYLWYDFNHPFVVMLDYNVYQPWMHHHFYVSNYPKYYYHTTFSDSYRNTSNPVYGFNENDRSPIFTSRKTNNSVRQNPISQTQRVEQTQPAQTMKYYGKNIGRPVKVQPQMKKSSQRKTPVQTSRKKQQ